MVTDFTLHILAVNRRLLDVLGYEEHELVGQPVMALVTEGAELANDHAWVRRTLFEAAARHAEAVRAAAVRCPECDTGLPGKMTDYFEMCGIYYCSTACVKAARLANV